jgi:hypothetical protein
LWLAAQEEAVEVPPKVAAVVEPVGFVLELRFLSRLELTTQLLLAQVAQGVHLLPLEGEVALIPYLAQLLPRAVAAVALPAPIRLV